MKCELIEEFIEIEGGVVTVPCSGEATYELDDLYVCEDCATLFEEEELLWYGLQI